MLKEEKVPKEHSFPYQDSMLKFLALSCQSRQSHWLVFHLKKTPQVSNLSLLLVFATFYEFLKIAKRTFQTDKLFRFAF